MEKRKENDSVNTGCGCLTTLFWIISICFVISVISKSCENGSIWEGTVSTAKEYYDVADSIWNKKE